MTNIIGSCYHVLDERRSLPKPATREALPIVSQTIKRQQQPNILPQCYDRCHQKSSSVTSAKESEPIHPVHSNCFFRDRKRRIDPTVKITFIRNVF